MILRILSEIFSRLIWFALHIDDKSSFPKPLSPAEEQRLFSEMLAGDKAAKDKLILHNLRLVAHIVKKYYVGADEQEELISIGTVGLIKAVNSFDPAKGNRFAAYGSRCIENEILMYFRSEKKTAQDVHFDEPIDVDKDGNSLTLMDIIAVDGDLGDEVATRLNSELLYMALASLDERERSIIVLRYGLYGRNPLTQRETASLLGISRSYVSRIEKKAIDKLKAEFGEEIDGE